MDDYPYRYTGDDEPDGMVHAPFKEQQINSINRKQKDDKFHEYTCDCGKELFATKEGLRCPDCKDFLQTWVYKEDAN